MKLLTLRFTCPVYVVIDTDTNEIDSVVVGDDQLSLTHSGVFNSLGFEATPAQTLEAESSYMRCAENGTDWPSWQFGW